MCLEEDKVNSWTLVYGVWGFILWLGDISYEGLWTASVCTLQLFLSVPSASLVWPMPFSLCNIRMSLLPKHMERRLLWDAELVNLHENQLQRLFFLALLHHIKSWTLKVGFTVTLFFPLLLVSRVLGPEMLYCLFSYMPFWEKFVAVIFSVLRIGLEDLVDC